MSAGMVIIGAGQAGLQIAESLRAEDYKGRIVLLGEEAYPPYQRPPLSKAVLLGDMTPDRLTLRSPEAIARKDIDFRPGVAATAVDRAARQVKLGSGESLAYEGLAFATGGRARKLPIPGIEFANVLSLRGIDDSIAIGKALNAAQNIVVIGGGFIGLEVAAGGRKFNKNVTVLEAAPRLMARAVSSYLSQAYLELHREHGVEILLDAMVSEIAGTDNRANAVWLKDGRSFPADLVIHATGLAPNTELAVAAGLDGKDGIIVDACGRTTDPHVVAAGDCIARKLSDGSLQRLESVQNAVELGKAAAASLVGREKPFTASPWFWSDQYDVKLQMAGTSAGHDHIEIRGDRAARKFSAFYFKGDTMVGVDSLNRPSDHMAARRLLDRGRSPTRAQAHDDTFALASLLS
jgi:3-phenylpropionate/trans-cinnamate dioxygenase ferredoxin reductase subunit